MVRESVFSERKQFPILGIRFNLVVPQFGVEPCEPNAKSLHLIQGEALHLPLDVLDSTHLKLHYQITLLVCGTQNDEWVFDSGAGNLAQCHIVFVRIGIRQKLWGRLATCGGLLTRRKPL